jgi:Tol biopolymer transport system component
MIDRRCRLLGVAMVSLTSALAGFGMSTSALSAPTEGPQLAFTALDALKPRGFSVRMMGVDARTAVVLKRGSKRGVVPNPFFSASWSADGVWLAFAGWQGKRKGIYKLRSDGTGLRFVHGTNGGRNPIFSADGSKIAFIREWRGRGSLNSATATWLAGADGRGARRLTPWRKNVEYLPSSFSPDATALAVTRSNFLSGKSSVLLLRLGRERGVRLVARRASEAVFSPAGSQLAVVRQVAPRRRDPQTANRDLYVMSIDGATSYPVKRTRHTAETHPSWDPSGQRIAFNSFHTSSDPFEALFDRLLPVGNSIMQINADGSCRQKLLSLQDAALYGPVWRPGPGHAAGRIEC